MISRFKMVISSLQTDQLPEGSNNLQQKSGIHCIQRLSMGFLLFFIFPYDQNVRRPHLSS